MWQVFFFKNQEKYYEKRSILPLVEVQKLSKQGGVLLIKQPPRSVEQEVVERAEPANFFIKSRVALKSLKSALLAHTEQQALQHTLLLPPPQHIQQP